MTVLSSMYAGDLEWRAFVSRIGNCKQSDLRATTRLAVGTTNGVPGFVLSVSFKAEAS